MSGLDWTTTELLAQIRDVARIPDADPDATDAKLLAIANRQLDTVFVPMVRKARSDYYVTHLDYAITLDQAEYRIPPRATSATVRSVVWVTTALVEIELPPAPLTDRHLYAPVKGFPVAYAIQDDRIVVMPTPNASQLGTLRIRYERRPSKLVPTSQATSVLTVTSASRVVLASDYANLAPYIAGDLFDFVVATPPFSLRMQDTAFVTGAGADNTFTPSSADRTPVTGDIVCRAGETTVPQIPAELIPLLVVATAAEYMRPIDPTFSATLKADLKDALDEQRSLLSPRQQGRQLKVKSTASVMRQGGRRRGTFGDWRP